MKQSSSDLKLEHNKTTNSTSLVFSEKKKKKQQKTYQF